MKIAVYTIAKNEEKFVEAWHQSTRDADYRLILDTGSTDRTVDLARSFGIDVHTIDISPWRFDTARNMALNIVPEDIDYCIALDMDEVLCFGWRNQIEKIDKSITRPRYKYVWSWLEDGKEGLVYGGDKIHSRHGYRWKHPVHEVLIPNGIKEKQSWIKDFEIHHHPDPTKSRGQYFDLLKLAVEEDPKNDRNQFYLAREYFYNNQIEKAIDHFNQFLELSTWSAERAAAYRMLFKLTNNLTFLYLALMEDPIRKETLVALADYYYRTNNWKACKHFAEAAIAITEKPLDYLCEADAWGFAPYDFAAIACYNLGEVKKALNYGHEAVVINPKNTRLIDNLNWYIKTKNSN